VKASSHNGHCINLDGSNTTNLYACYASQPGEGKAGYRIIAGSPVSLYSCTGLDDGDSHWGLFGAMAAVAGSTRSGGSTSIIRISASDPAETGQYDGGQIQITSGTHDGEYFTIYKNVKGDGTHGNYIQITSNNLLSGTLPSGTTYEISDGDSRWQNAGDPYARDARISLYDCNIESWSKTGIKFFRRGLATIQNPMFYHPTDVSPAYDCCIYINEGDDTHTVKLAQAKYDLAGSRNYVADHIQAKGSSPHMMCERLESSMRTIYSLEAGAALRMMYFSPTGITLPTGFPTSNPGPGKLWSDGGTLKVGT
jgi:hypothetical protein